MPVAVYASVEDIISAVNAAGTAIPPGFFVGVAQVESRNALNTNEPNDQPGGSWGIYRLGPGAGREIESELGIHVEPTDLYDLQFSTNIFALLSETRAPILLAAAGLDPSDLANAPPDLWAYLELWHNMGGGVAVPSVQNYGMNWAAYKSRNPDQGIVANGSGDLIIQDAIQYPTAPTIVRFVASNKTPLLVGAGILAAVGIGVAIARS